MKRTSTRRISLVLAAMWLAGCGAYASNSAPNGTYVARSAGADATGASAYDKVILADKPVMYLEMRSGNLREADATGNGHDGTYHPGQPPPTVKLPNGDPAARFDGSSQYLEVPSSLALSVPATGRLTIEAWIRPDTLQFPHQEGSGYVYFLGKGQPGEYEYADRMYSKLNSEVRPNRISDYAWNLNGGLGSGAYFQDRVRAGQWIYVVAVIDMADTSSSYPTGYIAIYKDGVLRGTVGLDQFMVVPKAGHAPFRVASRDLNSFFKGAIGKVAAYGYVLTQAQILSHYRTMT